MTNEEFLSGILDIDFEKMTREESTILIKQLTSLAFQMSANLAAVERKLDQVLNQRGTPEQHDASQMGLFGDAEHDSAESPEEDEDDDPLPDDEIVGKRRRRSRKRLCEKLPTIVVECELEGDELKCPCCSSERRKIGEEVSSELDRLPEVFFCRKFVRFRYACPNCRSGRAIEVAPKPYRPIEKSMAGPGLLAYIIVSKFADHAPTARLERILKRFDIDVSRQAMWEWFRRIARQFQPLYDCLVEQVRASKVIQTDETSLRMINKGAAADSESDYGHIWIYRGDPDHPFSIYEYAPTKAGQYPLAFLSRFAGFVQADAASVFDALYEDAACPKTEVGCWAHAQRRFKELLKCGDLNARPGTKLIGRMYDIEARAKQQAAKLHEADPNGSSWEILREVRGELRMTETRPLLEKLKEWMIDQIEVVRPLPKGDFFAALQYVRNQWDALTRFASNGILDIDNNPAENDLRTVALGRKNWLFCVSEEGARVAAMFMSFMKSCERNAVDPLAWMYDVLQRLPACPVSRVRDLAPDRWKPSSAAAWPQWPGSSRLPQLTAAN